MSTTSIVAQMLYCHSARGKEKEATSASLDFPNCININIDIKIQSLGIDRPREPFLIVDVDSFDQ